MARLKLLYADDDVGHLWVFRKSFARDFDVFTAPGGPEALEILEQEEDIAIVLADQRMPRMSGVEFLSRVYAHDPDPVRILVTGFSDLEDTLAAINAGHVFNYVAKPWVEEELRALLNQAASVFLLNRRNRELTRRLKQQNAQLARELARRRKAEEELFQSREHIRELTRQVLRAQEQERHRIALDLHDKVAQDLSSVKLMVETMSLDVQEDPAKVNEWRPQLLAVLHKTIDAVRDLSATLRPPALARLGLAGPMEQYCREKTRFHGLRLDFHADIDNVAIPDDICINLYRLLQEAVNNACLHAGASWLQVDLRHAGDEVQLAVVDNGCGFDLEAARRRAREEKRLGLQSMEERAGLLGGRLQLDTAPGRGTVVRVHVPLS